jgi:hypothetical protein
VPACDPVRSSAIGPGDDAGCRYCWFTWNLRPPPPDPRARSSTGCAMVPHSFASLKDADRYRRHPALPRQNKSAPQARHAVVLAGKARQLLYPPAIRTPGAVLPTCCGAGPRTAGTVVDLDAARTCRCHSAPYFSASSWAAAVAARGTALIVPVAGGGDGLDRRRQRRRARPRSCRCARCWRPSRQAPASRERACS